MPFGSSAYMGGFGSMTPIVQMPQYSHPMDMMGYGSYTMNFNTPSAKMGGGPVMGGFQDNFY